MKIASLPLLIFLAVCAATEFARAADAPPPWAADLQWKLTVECQMVVLPEKIALPLLPELLDEAKIEAAFAKVQALISEGTAQLAANLVAQSHEGKKATAESIEELRYGTEFDPPQLPPNAPEDVKVLREWPVTGITPTAFETRNVGAALEVESTPIRSGKLWQVQAAPQHVRFLRWAKTDAGRLANGERLTVEQPIFHTIKNFSTVTMTSGQRLLLGVHKLAEPEKTIELFFLRLTAAPVKTP